MENISDKISDSVKKKKASAKSPAKTKRKRRRSMAQAKQMKPEKTRKSDFKFTRDLIDGLAKKQNVVLMTGIVNAPVIIAATTFKKGVVIALAFAIISFLTIVTCSFVPKK